MDVQMILADGAGTLMDRYRELPEFWREKIVYPSFHSILILICIATLKSILHYGGTGSWSPYLYQYLSESFWMTIWRLLNSIQWPVVLLSFFLSAFRKWTRVKLGELLQRQHQQLSSPPSGDEGYLNKIGDSFQDPYRYVAKEGRASRIRATETIKRLQGDVSQLRREKTSDKLKIESLLERQQEDHRLLKMLREQTGGHVYMAPLARFDGAALCLSGPMKMGEDEKHQLSRLDMESLRGTFRELDKSMVVSNTGYSLSLALRDYNGFHNPVVAACYFEANWTIVSEYALMQTYLDIFSPYLTSILSKHDMLTTLRVVSSSSPFKPVTIPPADEPVMKRLKREYGSRILPETVGANIEKPYPTIVFIEWASTTATLAGVVDLMPCDMTQDEQRRYGRHEASEILKRFCSYTKFPELPLNQSQGLTDIIKAFLSQPALFILINHHATVKPHKNFDQFCSSMETLLTNIAMMKDVRENCSFEDDKAD